MAAAERLSSGRCQGGGRIRWRPFSAAALVAGSFAQPSGSPLLAVASDVAAASVGDFPISARPLVTSSVSVKISTFDNPDSIPCGEGRFQVDPIVFSCGGGRGRKNLWLAAAGSPEAVFEWQAPKGTQGLSAVARLHSIAGQEVDIAPATPSFGSSVTGGPVLVVQCREHQEVLVSSKGGALNAGVKTATIDGAKWSWSGDPTKEDEDGFFVLSLLVVGGNGLGCQSEVILHNVGSFPLAGEIEYAWDAIKPCPEALPGCVECPSDVCKSTEEASCDGSPFWKCESKPGQPSMPALEVTGAVVASTTVAMKDIGSRLSKQSPLISGNVALVPPSLEADMTAAAASAAEAVKMSESGKRDSEIELAPELVHAEHASQIATSTYGVATTAASNDASSTEASSSVTEILACVAGILAALAVGAAIGLVALHILSARKGESGLSEEVRHPQNDSGRLGKYGNIHDEEARGSGDTVVE